ncbi:ATP-binding protein [Infirmifilum lucidum]|uniref:ATP-binding protein n=1 Tax=Infirmifilum lucidum TaxID=2776706 RepID=A0A7L9FIW4_9CREN|nr:ATP-binding protein [Infirmifilum lucidum]QOJ78836.1 ATP-binding protein [Infirmifilum lucidum]
MVIEIARRECSWLRATEGWLLVYGRRKTGKTWLLRRCLDWDMYVTVTRGGECIVESSGGVDTLPLADCLKAVTARVRGEEALAVLDEFQRLPEKYWDLVAVAYQEAKGRLVLCGSSLGVSRKVFDSRSPLLGLLAPLPVRVASMSDTVASLSRHMGPRDAVLWAVVARDPWLIPHLDFSRKPWEDLALKAEPLSMAAGGLVGEVFMEEERSLTRAYEATLRALASGEWRLSAVSQRLYSAGLVSSPAPSTVTGLLGVLEGMGLVEGIRLWRTRGAKSYYRLASPAVSLLLYADEKYLSAGLQPRPEDLKARFALEAQFAVGEVLAEYKGLRQAYTVTPEGDLDVVLLDASGAPAIAYEVKVGAVTEAEARRGAELARKLGVPKFGAVSLTERPEAAWLDEAYGPEDLVEASRRASEKALRAGNL